MVETGGLENVPSFGVLPVFSRLAPRIIGAARDVRAHSARSMQLCVQSRAFRSETKTNAYRKTSKLGALQSQHGLGNTLVLRFREARALRAIPGVNEINATIIEVCHIASCELGLS